MRVIDIKEFENKANENYSIIWFVVEDYPEDVFGIKNFPKSNNKQDYILQKGKIQNVKKTRIIESNLKEIKESIADEIGNYPKIKLKLLFQTDYLLT